MLKMFKGNIKVKMYLYKMFYLVQKCVYIYIYSTYICMSLKTIYCTVYRRPPY